MDRLSLAALTLCLAFGGALAIASDLVRDARLVKTMPVVQLERVVVVGKRLAPAAAVAVTERAEPATQRAQ